jgi:hypothetical protein
MDEPAPLPEDLSSLERRLAAWQPSGDGVPAEADRMLFAAGRASAARLRLLWPAAAACLALLAAGLGAWVASERGQRLALARQLQEQGPHPQPVLVQREPAAPDPLPPQSYLMLRRAWENDPDGSPPPQAPGPPPGPPPDGPPILQVGQRDRWPDL